MHLMLREMEAHYRKKPVIYVTVDFYADMMHPNEFKDYPVWVRSTKYEPSVHYPGRAWTFWQYQSDARLPGVRGNIDRNVFLRHARTMARVARRPAPAPRELTCYSQRRTRAA